MAKTRKAVWLGVLAAWAGLSVAQGKGLFDKTEEEGFGGKVVVMRIGESDLMSKQSFRFMRRILEKVENEKAAALVIEIDNGDTVVLGALGDPDNYILETSTILEPDDWQPLEAEPTTTPDGFTYTLPKEDEKRFYRLRRK